MCDSSPLTDNADVDAKNHRVSVGWGSAYDLFLTRELSQAEIVRFPGASPALAALRAGDVDVAKPAIRQVLVGEAKRDAEVRVLPGRFMLIQQAMGMPADPRGAPRRRRCWLRSSKK